MRILLAMSGGVDSSVAAALLRDGGHEVIGVTLRLVTSGAQDDEGIEAARRVARVLGVEHRLLDHRQAFEELVLKRCWSEYTRGRTPNPCVVCNPCFKFRSLLALAAELGVARVASGHHARIDEEGPILLRGQDRDKDQSYFLARLSDDQLGKIWFPVGAYTKSEVRRMARVLGLPNANKPESQDACFAQRGDRFAEALRRRFGEPSSPGELVDTQNHTLGRHDGIHLFTIGQRRGLGIALGRRAWVKSIDAQTSRIIVASRESDLLADGLLASSVVWGPGYSDFTTGPAEVQVRSRHRPARATLERWGEDRVRVRFEQPQRSVTPGQAAVFYDGDRVMGCGWIEHSNSGDPDLTLERA